MSKYIQTWLKMASFSRSVSSLQILAPKGFRYCQVRTMKLYQERTVRAMYWRGKSFDKVKLNKRRDEMQEWNYRSEIYAFSRRLQEDLSEDTLRQVFAHPSYVRNLEQQQAQINMPAPNITSNESLVSRGLELLEICTKPYLRYTFKHVPEDGIKAIHKYIESEVVMADMALWFGCKDIILSDKYPPTQKSMADTVLAILAGVERDLGIARARRFTIDMILSYLVEKDILDDVWIIPNPEEMVQHVLKNSQLPPYEARIVFQTGVGTLEPCHIIGLYVDKKLIGSSAGETLEIAENCAAIDALRRFFDLTENREPMKFGADTDKIDYSCCDKEHDYVETWKLGKGRKV